MKITTSNATLMVTNMDRAIKFYEQLGLTLKQRWGDNYAMIAAADIIIGLHPGSETYTDQGKISFGFMIESIDEGAKLLDSMGVKYTRHDDASGGPMLNFQDPDGTYLYYMEPRW